MKATVFAALLLSICILSGCKRYRAEALVLVKQPEGTPYDPSFFAAEAETVKALADPLLPQRAKILVEHITPETQLLRITVTMDDPRVACAICSLVAKTYIKHEKVNVTKSLHEGITVVQTPIGNRHAKKRY